MHAGLDELGKVLAVLGDAEINHGQLGKGVLNIQMVNKTPLSLFVI